MSGGWWSAHRSGNNIREKGFLKTAFDVGKRQGERLAKLEEEMREFTARG